MKNKIKKIFKSLTPWEVEEEFDSNDKMQSKEAKFILSYKEKEIGVLEYKDNLWKFSYTEDYKEQQFVKPIIDFPDVNKEYTFETLLPFFASRIPNLNQPYHAKKLKKHNADKRDLVSLLEIFGKKSINNPFTLKMC